MDLPRFVSILSTGKLWFPKAATLRDDPYEGYGKAKVFEVPSPDEGRKWITHREGAKESMISGAEMGTNISKMSAQIVEDASEHLYVNSWCLGESESMAMWQIYGSLGFGVAVKSSESQYQRAARFAVDESYYDVGPVAYHDDLKSAAAICRDFSKGSIPLIGSSSLRREVLKLGFHKRSCYGYETEWRAVIYQELRPEIPGVQEAFDLDQLISAVYAGPRAEAFVCDAVFSVMEKFGLTKPLKKSDLLSR
jgi:hypothetical protein